MNRPIAKSKKRLKPPHIAKAPQRAIVKAGPPTVSEAIERTLLLGDLTALSVEQRLEYYKAVCKSLGLNYLTSPFGYIAFKENENSPAKLVLYAKKDCCEQLRRIHGISVTSSEAGREENDYYVCRVTVRDKNGRIDTGTGAVALKDKYDKPLTGRNFVNAIMKAETKAKRRATLSAAGLGVIDESELETMETYSVSPTGRVIEIKEAPAENVHLTHYEQREAEELKKLNPAQREVVERKMAEAKAKENPQKDHDPSADTEAAASPREHTPGAAAPDLSLQRKDGTLPYEGLTCRQIENGWYELDGPDEVKKVNRDILKPLWRINAKPPRLMAEGAEFGKLCRVFEERKIRFRIV